MLIELVLAITALNFLFSVWMLRLLTMELHKTVNQLDAMLATAIQGLIEKGMGELEPVKPIQAAIAQMLTNNLANHSSRPTASVIDVEVVRDAAGKFS